MVQKEKKILTREEITEKIKHFCAWQERSRLQVSRKLKALGLAPEAEEEMMLMLSEEGYLNEKRFVEQFVRTRSAAKGWGPAKIAAGLFRETGSRRDEDLTADSVSEKKALEKLEKDLRKKSAELLRKQDSRIREKLIRFCLSRGFDFETASEISARVIQ